MQDCIFCKIIERKIPTELIEENDSVVVIKDIAPKAPIHYLIIPKNHIESVAHMGEGHGADGLAVLQMAQKLGKSLPGSQSFRLIMNNGVDAGQTVFHMHCHFISGKKLSDF